MIRKLVRQMLTAQVFSALTVSLCLLIDSIMIGRFLGEQAIAAYGLANPLLLAIGAIGSLLAAGIQVTCSRSLGRGSQEETNAGYSSAIMVAGIISGVFMVAAILFRSFFAKAMGAGSSGELFNQTRDYIAGFSIGAPGSMGALVLVPFLQMAGQSNLLIAAVLTMTIADIGLDLLNVLVFNGGMFGMGLASAISYYAAMVVSAFYFLSKKCVFRFTRKGVTVKKMLELFKSGVPAGFSMAAAMVLVFVMNHILMSTGGEDALSAFTVMMSLGNAAQCINTGTGGVSLTLSGMFVQEEDRNSLKELLWLLFRYAVILGLGMGLVLLVFAGPLVGLFITEPGKARDMAALALRLYATGLIPCCACSALKNCYQAEGKIALTEILHLTEGALLPAVAGFILSRIWGTTGAWLYFVAGELLAVLAICLLIRHKTGRKPWDGDAFLMLDEDFGVGPDEMMEAEIRSIQDVTAVAEQAQQFCMRHSRDNRMGNHIALCIEEMASNTVQHGFSKDAENHLSVRILHKPDAWVLRFRDDCRAFDPVHYIPANGKKAVGIHLVLALASDARYTYSMNMNNLSLRLPETDKK
ncbi:MAG: ATP-binding protein [Clostridia bacterium]|nr:ATP-binding protein [Clostridia bacterium]